MIVNPNNPDGRVMPASTLLEIAERLARRGAYLIVDESFAEVAEQDSVAAFDRPGLIVLRSFGKFYGLAGLRLGFVITSETLAARLRAAGGDWPVSADALAGGLAAYNDPQWATQARARLRRDSVSFKQVLTGAGFKIVGGTDLFCLTASEDAAGRFEALGAMGILTRPFDDHPQWLRFGLPHPSAQNRVEKALETLR